MFKWLFGGGSDETKTKIPEYLQRASQDALRRGADVADMGYVPYMGPEVAAFQPQQLTAMSNNQSMAADLGLDAGPGYTPPPTTDFGNGMVGYGSYDPFMALLDQFRAERPGQFDYINSMFIDPVTGEPGSRSMQAVRAAQQQQQPTMVNGQMYGGGGDGQGVDIGGGQPTGGGLGLSDMSIGGWNVSDLWDGGGFGASGGAYSGGGLLSTVSNIGREIAGKGTKK